VAKIGRGVSDIKMWSSSTPVLPIVLELAIEMGATEVDDSVGAANGPEHAGLLEAGADDGLASGFDDARADKQVLAAKLGVAHALGISFKIICLDAQFLDNFWIG
jgi:hypothetical protein